MVISKGDKVVITDEKGYKLLDNMMDFCIVESIREEGGFLKVYFKFKYNSIEAYKQGKELGKVTKGYGEWFYFDWKFGRDDAFELIRPYHSSSIKGSIHEGKTG